MKDQIIKKIQDLNKELHILLKKEFGENYSYKSLQANQIFELIKKYRKTNLLKLEDRVKLRRFWEYLRIRENNYKIETLGGMSKLDFEDKIIALSFQIFNHFYIKINENELNKMCRHFAHLKLNFEKYREINKRPVIISSKSRSFIDLVKSVLTNELNIMSYQIDIGNSSSKITALYDLFGGYINGDTERMNQKEKLAFSKASHKPKLWDVVDENSKKIIIINEFLSNNNDTNFSIKNFWFFMTRNQIVDLSLVKIENIDNEVVRNEKKAPFVWNPLIVITNKTKEEVGELLGKKESTFVCFFELDEKNAH